jgi:hypothetical protein
MQSAEKSIEARYEDETIWLSQKLMATLFEVEVNTINYHLKEIFKAEELQENSVIRNFRITAAETEFEKYRVVQDRLFESDFDKQIKKPLGGLTYE